MRARMGIASRLIRSAAWVPLAVIALHSIAGQLFGHEPYVDPMTHFLGGTAAAFFVLQASSIASAALGTLKPAGRDLLALGITCAAALCWEVAEFASDRVLGTNVQRSLDNTMRDLILGAVGGVVCIAVSRAIEARRARATGSERT